MSRLKVIKRSPAEVGIRPFGLLRQRGLPDDLFGDVDPRQAAIDHLEARSLVATGALLPWRATLALALVLKLAAHQLWDPRQCEANADHCMPAYVEDTLRHGGFLISTDRSRPCKTSRLA